MKLEGAVELALDEEALTPLVICVLEKREGTFVAGCAGFEVEDSGLEGDAESSADVEGFGVRGEHILVGGVSSFSRWRRL